MSTLEDEIRETLRSEATRLREVRPLQLPPQARSGSRGAPPARRAPRLRSWLAPVAAVAAVVLVAVALMTLRSLGSRPAATPAASAGPRASTGAIAGPALAAGVIPRYYVSIEWASKSASWAIVAGDRQAGKAIGTYPLPKGGTLFSGAVSGAADDQTFVVSAAPTRDVAGPPAFYLVRISPGSAQPVGVTKLPLDYPAPDQVSQLGLSADGTELAVVSANAPLKAHQPLSLRVFSVATGQLQHSWSTGLPVSEPVTGLSWVGDGTVGFTVTRSPEVREEVRTLDVSKTGTNLIADSRRVWSQYVPAAPHGTAHAPHACDTPVLTGDGQAVACGNGTYSAASKRMTAAWLAYPLATPTRPRVIGSITQPPYVTNFNGPVAVNWVNASGTAAVGSWNTSFGKDGGTEVNNFTGVIENGQVKPFARVPAFQVAW